ncbi:branched-chain amino acid ABC transporter permease [Vulcanimicrobium alpinum]|uniref:branched-chain amino acid ABC transporter permease n=1 Tax=Vulcanimicrobium alpinum TaxID=3016050 RepID=UPI00386F1991
MSPDYLLTQIFNGLASGAFYALLALGLSVIFGMLRVVNFAHGAMYMLGAFATYYGAQFVNARVADPNAAQVWFFASLLIAPAVVGLFGILLEVTLLRRLYGLDPIYSLLLTFALVLIIEDLMRLAAGPLGSPFATPPVLAGVTNIGFTLYPTYKLFVIVISLIVCALAWFIVERTPIGARIRAATENPVLVRALGIDVRRLVTITFGVGIALAALAGVLNAPQTNVQPNMGDTIIIYTFAIVVIGGLGSIVGSIVAGFALGLLQTIGAVVFPPISTTLIFIVMVIVIVFRPAGLFGKPESAR